VPPQPQAPAAERPGDGASAQFQLPPALYVLLERACRLRIRLHAAPRHVFMLRRRARSIYADRLFFFFRERAPHALVLRVIAL